MAARLPALLATLLPLSNAQCLVGIMGGAISVEGSPATAQPIFQPYGITVDSSGYFVSDSSGGGNRVVRVFFNGSMVTALGIFRNTGGWSGDGGRGTMAFINNPASVSADGGGGFLVCDKGNHLVRRLHPNGTVVRVAGNLTAGWSGDRGAATSATLNSPSGVSYDNSVVDGGAWIADTNK